MNMSTIRRGPQKLSLVDTGETPVIVVEPMRFIPLSQIAQFYALKRRGVIQP